MATERLAPDAILTQTGLSGTVAAIDDDPDSPDANWLVTSAQNQTNVLRVSFPSPTGALTAGADLQNFRAQLRKSSTNNGRTDDGWQLWLYENNTSIRQLNSGTGLPTSGTVVAGTWNASEVSGGTNVECRIVLTPEAGGNPGNRGCGEVGAVEWNVTYSVTSSGTGAPSLPAMTAAGTGELGAGGTITGTGSPSLPALTALGTAENTRKLEEYFDAPGYDNVGWTEEFAAASSDSGELDEDFVTTSVPGGRPTGWGPQCLKIRRTTGNVARAEGPSWGAIGKVYVSFDVVVGSDSQSDSQQAELFSLGAGGVYTITTFLRKVSGNLRFRFRVETAQNVYTDLDWTTNLSTSQKYRVEYLWDTAADDYEVWVDGTSVFSGTTTSPRQVARVYVGGIDTTGGPYTAYLDRIGVDSQARLPAAPPELPAMVVSGSGTVLIQGAGAVSLPALSTFRSLLWDTTEWTWDTTAVTWDATKLPTSEGAGEVVMTGTGSPVFPMLFASGIGTVLVQGTAAISLPTLTASGQGAVLVQGSGTPSLAAMTASGAGSVVLPIPKAAVTYTARALTLLTTLPIAKAGAVYTGYAPTIPTNADVTVQVGKAAVAYTGYAPVIGSSVIVPVGFASVDVTGYGPLVLTTTTTTVQVATASVTVTGYAPSVTVGGIGALVDVQLTGRMESLSLEGVIG